MSFAILGKTIGFLLIILSGAMCIPLGYAIAVDCPALYSFLEAAGITLTFGAALFLCFSRARGEFRKRGAFLLVSLIWVMAAFIGAIPYYLSGAFGGFVDALFESAAGFTTTGASVVTEIESLPESILLWRSLTQFLGGMGIVVLSLAVLPLIGVGGMDLFRAEAPGPTSDKISSRVSETARALWVLYLCFAIVQAVLLRLSGMSGFDAINHAMTTMATGGFSTKNNSIAHYDSEVIDYITSLFMFLAGVNFILFYKLIILGRRQIVADRELQFYFFIVISSIVIVTARVWGENYTELSDALRYSVFQVTSLASSTGFGTADYTTWPVFVQFLLVLLMVIGGSAGSTAGGMKCVRVMVVLKHATNELRKIVHPRAVLPLKIGGKVVSKNITDSVFGFVFLYLGLFVALTLALTWFELDLVSAATAVISCLSNIGPAFGELGPSTNYAGLPDAAKVLLSATMIIGRLEILTMLVVLSPLYWRSLAGK